MSSLHTPNSSLAIVPKPLAELAKNIRAKSGSDSLLCKFYYCNSILHVDLNEIS